MRDDCLGCGIPRSRRQQFVQRDSLAVDENAPQARLGNVDSKGITLYDFPPDKGTTSVCYGACAALWPPLVTKGKPVAGPGVRASLLGTTKRKDGKLEVTYAG